MEYDSKGRAEPMGKTKTYSLNKAQFCWPVFEDSLDKRRDWLCDLWKWISLLYDWQVESRVQ